MCYVYSGFKTVSLCLILIFLVVLFLFFAFCCSCFMSSMLLFGKLSVLELYPFKRSVFCFLRLFFCTALVEELQKSFSHTLFEGSFGFVFHSVFARNHYFYMGFQVVTDFWGWGHPICRQLVLTGEAVE